MSTAALLSFSLIALLTVLTPGLDTVLVLRTALFSGKRAAMRVVLGISLGCLVWGVASLAGLTALLTASELAYDVVRWLGAAYLVYLGAKALWDSRKAVSLEDSRPVPTAKASLRVGLLTNLLNPKVGVFYLSLLPQFMPVGQPAWGAVLVTVHLGLGLVWLPFLVVVAGRARAFLLRQRVLLDRLTASVLVALGLKLAFEAR
ncbi:LysE family translocator [Lentzea jiangxiensis]|uniref:Threonine/homoserine/homoserine lactone efflux protein n=1 Tax=Lentzea jiangxiensis TaxID=641025 RepID=A0A1H0GYG9_9PSEU|nr:LysE family translocator [Lentzea jiangxiensis]SDO11949.1 Threonine/homoserine/homoserine lactone efflux protein [Lentzea jiangxiensis]